MIDIRPLNGARIWLSGAISPEFDGAAVASFNAFVARVSELIFKAGGSIIHGSHPSIVESLLNSAESHLAHKGSRDSLTLVASKFFHDKYAAKLPDWRSKSIVHELPAADEDEAASLDRMRRWIVDRSDAIVSIGGRWWKENPGAAGVPQEFELGRERGLPCFLLAGLGGAAAGYIEARPEVMRNLRNGLDEAQNLKLAAEQNVERLAGQVVEQLCRLPLVRGEALGDTTFRILSLDGGGIKGAFTAAVLATLEKESGSRLTEHFDLIAGTSTGGILALGLGMGLSAADMLKFYEERGPTVFPVTSLSDKLWYSLRHLFTAKFAQMTLRAELDAAFAQAPGSKLSDSLCRLVIPAVHARTGSVYLFRTNHHPDLIAHKDAPATDIALATAAAPTYFRAAEVDDSTYVDGGLWANNPALAALTESVSRLHVPLNRLDILSIGTTSAPYSGRGTMRAGTAGWLKGGRIVELLMHAQAQGVIEMAGDLAGRARMVRIDEMLTPNEVSLDSVDRIADLKDYGRSVARKENVISEVTARFLNGVRVVPWTRY